MSNFTANLTHAGRKLNAELIVSEQPLVISGIEVGQGFVPDGTDPRDMTALADRFAQIESVRKFVLADTVSVFEFDYGSHIATDGMWLREIGIFAKRPDGEIILHSYFHAGDKADFIPPSGDSTFLERIIRILVEVSDAENVSFDVIVEQATVKARNIGTKAKGAGAYAGKGSDGTLLFKRFTGVGSVFVTETGGQISIGVDHKLTQDLDVYVPRNHPDAGDSPAFDTVQEAFDYLDDFNIPGNRWATVNLAAGVHELDEPLDITHSQSDRIRIVGAAPTVHNISAWSYNPTAQTESFALNNYDGIEIGDWCIVTGSPTGTGANNLPMHAQGVWQVSAINPPAHITLSNAPTWWRGPLASFPQSLNAGRGWIYKLRTQLKCTGDGIRAGTQGIGLISNVMIRGAAIGTGTAIDTKGAVKIDCVAVKDFSRGINIDGAVAMANVSLFASNWCSTAIYVSRAGALQAGNNAVILNGNSVGMRLETNTTASLSMTDSNFTQAYCLIHGGGTGVIMLGATMNTFGFLVSLNGQQGLSLSQGSKWLLGSTSPNRPTRFHENARAGGTQDLHCSNSSVAHGPIHGGAASGGNIGTVSPAQRTLGNSNSWIDIS